MDRFDARKATIDLVTAFVNNNSLKAQELPALLSEVYSAVAGFDDMPVDAPVKVSKSVAQPETPITAPAPEPVIENEKTNSTPAVSVKESLRDRNYIVSMITGEKMKTLARHLRRHGLDEHKYRERYNLPNDYPMVAPAYSELRRSVAKKMSLGRVGRKNLSDAKLPLSSDVVNSAPVKAGEVKVKAKSNKVEKPKAGKATGMAPGPKTPTSSLPSAPKKGRSAKSAADAVTPKITSQETAQISAPAPAPVKKVGRPATAKSKLSPTIKKAAPAAAKATTKESKAVLTPSTPQMTSLEVAADAKADRRKLKPVF